MSQPPRHIGRYRIVRLLGRGVARVYLAWHPRHGHVALKLLPPAYIQQPETERRFRREVRLLKQLNHPHVLRLIDSGTWRGPDGSHSYFMVTEYLPDGSLYDLLRQFPGGLPEPLALAVALQVAEALAYAHQRGVIHRDIKPGNILLRGGQVVLGDFGIARNLAEATISQDQRIVGTLAYMAPEQTWGDPQVVGRGSDIYALGVVCYEMLSGFQPRTNPDLNDFALIQLIQHTPLPPLSHVAPAVSREVAALVQTCIEPQRSQRYQSAEQLAEVLRRIIRARGYPQPVLHAPPPTPARPAVPWLLIGGVTTAIVALFLIALFVLLGRLGGTPLG